VKDSSWAKRRGKPRELYDETYEELTRIIRKYEATYLSRDKIIGIISEAFKDARSNNASYFNKSRRDQRREQG